MTNFDTWFDTFIEEKGINLGAFFTVEGPSGTNYMEVGNVVDAIRQAPAREQQGIKAKLVELDFHGASPFGYFKHLAQAIAQ